ncbi:MAG: non-hydrolyzing UDP-N-acetylglucosamine 2-epimerase, partial [Anaerolineales bacterium]
MRVLTVIGTRPEAVKMAPVVAALQARPGVALFVVATAQHREMMDQVLRIFDITPDFDLDVMEADQSPTDVLAQVLLRLQPVLAKTQPDWLLVQGDTTTVLGAALAASYGKVKVGHVEAGLRTYDRANPFPEELNRVLADHASTLHFAPTDTAREALLREGFAPESVHVTGNTVIDALQTIVQRPPNGRLPEAPAGRKLVLVTAHRRENHGQPIRDICMALRELARRDDVHVIYPVHRNPNISGPVHELLGAQPNVVLLDPVDYVTFVHLMGKAHVILT